MSETGTQNVLKFEANVAQSLRIMDLKNHKIWTNQYKVMTKNMKPTHKNACSSSALFVSFYDKTRQTWTHDF